MLANPNIIETVSDPRIGQVDLVPGPPPYDLCFIKRTQHNSPEEMENELARLTVRRNLKEKRLLQVFEVRQVGGLVSEVAYEFPSGADFQPDISQADKLFCFTELLEALASMQKLKTFHGDIRPDYVCYNQEEGRVVLIERLKERNAPLHLQLANIKKGRNLYLSGRIYDELMAKKSSMKHNSYKSDVFQLGMVFLELFAGETRVQKLYNRDRRAFDWSGLSSILEQQKRDSDDKSIQSFFDFLRDFVLQKEEDRVATPIDALKIYYGFHRPAPTIQNSAKKLSIGARDPETTLRTEAVKIERSKSEGGVIRSATAIDLRPFGKDKKIDDALEEVVQYNFSVRPSDQMGPEIHARNSDEKQKNPTISSNGKSKAKLSGLVRSGSKSKSSATKPGLGVQKVTQYWGESSKKKQRDVDSNLTSLAKPRLTPFVTPSKNGRVLGPQKAGRTPTCEKVNKSLSKIFDDEAQNSTTSLCRSRPNLSVEKVVELQIPRQVSELAKPPRAICISPNMSYFNKKSVHGFPDKPQFIESSFSVSKETKIPDCPLLKAYKDNNLPLQNVYNEIEVQVSKRVPDKENVNLNNRTRSGTCGPVSGHSNPPSSKDRVSGIRTAVEEIHEGRSSHPPVSQSITSIISSPYERPSQTPKSNERGSIIPASQVSGSNVSVSYLSSHYLVNGLTPMSQPLTSCTPMYQLSNLSTCHPLQKGLLIDITDQNLRPSQPKGMSKPETTLFRNTQVPFTSNQPQNHPLPKPLLTPQYVSRAEAPFDSKPKPVYESRTPSGSFDLPYKSSQSDIVYSGSTRFLDAKWSPIKLEKLSRNLPKLQTSKPSSDLELTF